MLLIVFSLFFSFNLCAQTFAEGEYYNFKITKKLKTQLASNDNIRFSLYNPTQETKVFYLVLEDDQSTGYWSKLNFKTTIFPGENQLSFNLKRFVGERGSVKYARSINYLKLKKMFMVVNPDNPKNIKYTVKNIAYFKNVDLKIPSGMLAYSFQHSKLKTNPHPLFTTITEQSSYNKRRKAGFIDLDVWQFRDSKISPHYLSHVISAKKAKFRVDLPKGNYNVYLVWDELGYWDIPFWAKRQLYINNKPILAEKRSVDDFLDDLFSFANEPESSSHVYDYFFKNIFKKYEFNLENKGSFLEFDFRGDISSLALNALFIVPESMKNEANTFFKKLDAYSKEKINQHYREIKHNDIKLPLAIEITDISMPYLANIKCDGVNKNEVIWANNGDKQVDLCISANAGEVKIFVSDFSDGKNIIKSSAFNLKQYNYEFKSVDLNHETYRLEANKVSDSSFNIKMNSYKNRYLSLALFGGAYKSGKYNGYVSITQNKKTIKKKLIINILNKKYPTFQMKAGVIGLNPFPSTYYNSDKLEVLSAIAHNEALDKLQELGLTLFTDIPTPILTYRRPTFEKFNLNTKNSLEFLTKTKSKKIFLYNGSFPKKFFNDNDRNSSQTQTEFFENMKNELNRFQIDSKKEMIYLYSDEATGYRDAVNNDLALIKLYKNRFPNLLLGGFGNLYDWDKGKDLYRSWSFGLYSDIPNKNLLRKVKRANQDFGVYNLCADNQYDLSFCFGLQLYRLYKANIKYYFEWHASAIHNYPYMDLDGREADIGIFYPQKDGTVGVTKRYQQIVYGLETFKKLILLDDYLDKRKAPGLQEQKAKRWLKKLNDSSLFPIKKYYEINQQKSHKIQGELDQWLKIFFI